MILLLLKLLCLLVLWFLAVGPALWYGVILQFECFRFLRPHPDPSEGDDLAQYDRWRQHTDESDWTRLIDEIQAQDRR